MKYILEAIFFGTVLAERIANKLNENVVVIEKNHIRGEIAIQWMILLLAFIIAFKEHIFFILPTSGYS